MPSTTRTAPEPAFAQHESTSQEAQNAALRVCGVRGIRNELHVRNLDGERRSDAELRAAVIRVLVLDSSIPGTVDATVQGRRVLVGNAALLTEARPIDDIRSTAKYRAAVAANLLEEFLRQLA